MKSILSQLYHGELVPEDQYFHKMEAYQELYREHMCHHKSFIEKLGVLSPALQEEFIDIMNEQLEEVPLELTETFIGGFQLDARMMIELYQDN